MNKEIYKLIKTKKLNLGDYVQFNKEKNNDIKGYIINIDKNKYDITEYDKDGEELLKVWPGNLNIKMPKMILKKENIRHLMVIKSIQKIKNNRYRVFANTMVDGIVSISGEALIVVL